MPVKFKKLTKTDGELPAIVKVWEEKQEDLKKQGLWEKEFTNLATNKRSNLLELLL